MDKLAPKIVRMPAEPPDSIPDTRAEDHEYDEVLFDLCRNDDYHGLYREFIKRAAIKPKPNQHRGFFMFNATPAETPDTPTD